MSRKWMCGWTMFFFNVVGSSLCAMSMEQLVQSMDMMRGACAPKFQLTTEILDGLRKGVFVEDKDLKCYTLCIAQMAGTVTKKNEINLDKTIRQLEAMVPAEFKQIAVDTAIACKDVQKQYKDPCEKTFYSTKCGFELQPGLFMFP